MADVLADAPAGGDLDDVAGAEGVVGVVDEMVFVAVEILERLRLAVALEIAVAVFRRRLRAISALQAPRYGWKEGSAHLANFLIPLLRPNPDLNSLIHQTRGSDNRIDRAAARLKVAHFHPIFSLSKPGGEVKRFARFERRRPNAGVSRLIEVLPAGAMDGDFGG